MTGPELRHLARPLVIHSAHSTHSKLSAKIHVILICALTGFVRIRSMEDPTSSKNVSDAHAPSQASR